MEVLESRPAGVRLRAALPGLHPAEARVARVFLDAAGTAQPMTIAEVARRAQTSTASVVRLFQRLGYPRFSAFWVDLTVEARRDQTARDIPDGATSDIDREDSLADIVRKVSTNERLSLEDTADVLDLAALDAAVEAIAGAPRVDLYGAGAGAVVLLDLQQKLSRIGRTALHWGDDHAALTAAAALSGPAVALGVSHSGRTSSTVEFLRLARDSGATTIALTNFDGVPLCEHADIVLHTAARETPFRSGALGSRVAQHLVLDCLFIGVAQRAYDQSMTALRSTFHAVHGR